VLRRTARCVTDEIAYISESEQKDDQRKQGKLPVEQQPKNDECQIDQQEVQLKQPEHGNNPKAAGVSIWNQISNDHRYDHQNIYKQKNISKKNLHRILIQAAYRSKYRKLNDSNANSSINIAAEGSFF
jgi:hypothetical protein